MQNEETTECGRLSEVVIGCAIAVHRELGPGLLESTYEQCLARELTLSGLSFRQQVMLPIEYRGLLLERGYRIDFLVENRMILEVKSVDRILSIHRAQLLTYLRHSRIRIGLIINFNSGLLRHGIRRCILSSR